MPRRLTGSAALAIMLLALGRPLTAQVTNGGFEAMLTGWSQAGIDCKDVLPPPYLHSFIQALSGCLVVRLEGSAL